ncbi:Flagellar hook-length control protein FliK [hydrothermal vent metagenome]|uniref:Flagellar hook-length control protein FliK n=1 Tax=hydrothermal vent metagenome TaxID=652676 RepID=A0A1W1E1N4_9ZZZZ
MDDLIVGNSGDEIESGKSYVVFGKTDTNTVSVSTVAQGTGGFIINGETKKDFSGYSVSSAGDVNGDGLDDLIVGAAYAAKSGKTYVVFGKTENTAVNLGAIASGTGGFVINGEKEGDKSGFSVSAAGDVNGDGLDDLIVGAFGSDSFKGKSYVIFGKTNTNAINLSQLGDDSKYTIDHQGDENNNTLVGATDTNKDEIFVAGAGNDTLTGNGGMDVFSAGTGNDTIIINASNITELEKIGAGNRANINGGGGIDTLKLDGSGLTLDFTKISNNRIKDIEKIDLTGSGDNTLKLNLNDILDASTSTNILKVLGNTGDKVNIDITKFVTNSANNITEDSVTYKIYTHSNAETNMALWIDTDLSVAQI